MLDREDAIICASSLRICANRWSSVAPRPKPSSQRRSWRDKGSQNTWCVIGFRKLGGARNKPGGGGVASRGRGNAIAGRPGTNITVTPLSVTPFAGSKYKCQRRRRIPAHRDRYGALRAYWRHERLRLRCGAESSSSNSRSSTTRSSSSTASIVHRGQKYAIALPPSGLPDFVLFKRALFHGTPMV